MNTNISTDFVEVVIKIPKSELEYAKRGYTKARADAVYRAIENGIVLPKGHGPLKDTSKFVYECSYSEYGCDVICRCDNCVHHVIGESDINDAPTVVATDKEERI